MPYQLPYQRDWDDELEAEWLSMSDVDFERAFAMIDRKELDVKEVHPQGGKVVKITHKPTGIRVERKCKAVIEECYREAFRELIVRTRVHLKQRRQQRSD